MVVCLQLLSSANFAVAGAQLARVSAHRGVLAFSRSQAVFTPATVAKSPSCAMLNTNKMRLKRTDAPWHDLSFMSGNAVMDTKDNTSRMECSIGSMPSSRSSSPPCRGQQAAQRRKLVRTDSPQTMDIDAAVCAAGLNEL